MAVPKLDLKRAGLVDDSLQLTRYERTHKWLQSCTDPSDSLAETDTVFSVHSEVAAAPDSAQPGSGAAGRARSRASHAQTLDYRNTTLEQTLGQVERYPLAYQEVREREHRARSLGAAVGNPHSLQMPGHWDPMHPDEDHRLADILAHTEDEYWGDLEGWQDPQQVKNFPRAFRGKVRSNTQRRKQRAEEVMGLLEFAESHACLDRRQITAALRIQNPRLWREYTGNRASIAGSADYVEEQWRFYGFCDSIEQARYIAMQGLSAGLGILERYPAQTARMRQGGFWDSATDLLPKYLMLDSELTRGAALLCRVTCSPPSRLPVAASSGPSACAQAMDDALAHADLCAYPEYILCYEGKPMQ